MENGFIPLSVPNLKGNEIKYVASALESEWVSTAGSYVNQFENKIAEYVGISGAVACQSGTAGLHIALLLCGVSSADMVIVPTLTFIAAVNPVKYIGAEPIFMDCDDSLCIDPLKVLDFCERECLFINNKLINKKSGKHIKAIVVVHIFGNMADMDAIVSIAEKYNLKVIEDATEALGTHYINSSKYVGKFAGTIGNIGVYSFNGNKIITTGGGGMIVSNDNNTLNRARHLTTQAKIDEIFFIHDEIGYNYRMTNIQAAVGLAQLEQLEKFIRIKMSNYYYYVDKISAIEGLFFLKFKKNIRPNYWFYALFCGDSFQCKRDQLIEKLSEHKIQSRPIWGLISEQKPYKNSQCYKIEKAYYYWKHIINLPCSTNLRREQIDFVVSNIANNSE